MSYQGHPLDGDPEIIRQAGDAVDAVYALHGLGAGERISSTLHFCAGAVGSSLERICAAGGKDKARVTMEEWIGTMAAIFSRRNGVRIKIQMEWRDDD